MTIVGIAVGVFGCLVVFATINLARIGVHDLSTSYGFQKFVGGAAGGVLILALGLWLATRKHPPSN